MGGRESLQSPPSIEKLVCAVATKKLIEDKATSEVCSLIKQKFPGIHFQPDCKTDAEAAWGAVTARCPHGRESLQSPPSIEKLVCAVATKKLIEDKATNEACSLIEKKFPGIHFQPDCKTVAEAAWDAVTARCPHGGLAKVDDVQQLVVV